jgi:hypothetical protein
VLLALRVILGKLALLALLVIKEKRVTLVLKVQLVILVLLEVKD